MLKFAQKYKHIVYTAIVVAMVIFAIIAIHILLKGDKSGSFGHKEMQGIDVSHHQGDIDWMTVSNANNIKFAYIKATEGVSHQDTRYKENTLGAKTHNIAVGSYHYFHPNVSVAKQYANFMDVVDPATQDLIPVVDIEENCDMTGKQICDSLALFISLFSENWDVKPIIYTNQRFYNNYLQRSFKKNNLWIARYGILRIKPMPQLEDTHAYILWQYSDRGVVNGIDGYVDLNTICNEYTLRDIFIDKQSTQTQI